MHVNQLRNSISYLDSNHLFTFINNINDKKITKVKNVYILFIYYFQEELVERAVQSFEEGVVEIWLEKVIFLQLYLNYIKLYFIYILFRRGVGGKSCAVLRGGRCGDLARKSYIFAIIFILY